MFSPEDELRPFKRPRANFHGGDASEAAFFHSIDFTESLEGLSDGLVSALEDSDFADCMLPALFDGSPDGITKLSSIPGEAAIHGTLRTAPLHSSPTLPAPIAASLSLSAPPSRRSAGGAGHHVPALASMLAPRAARAIQTSSNRPVDPSLPSGAFIPTPAAATANVPVSQLTALAGLTRPPLSSSPPVPASTLPGSNRTGADARARTAAPRPSGFGLGSPGPTGRTGAGVGSAKLGSGSASGPGLGMRSGSAAHGSGGNCTTLPTNTHGISKSKSTVAAAGGAGRSGGSATGFSGWSHSGLDGEDEDDEGLTDRRVRTSPGQRAVTTNPAAAAGTGGGGGGSAHPSGAGSLLLRIFNGAMRPEVAALAAAAAQRALVTSPTVPPGLYFTEPEQGDASRATPARSFKRGGKDKQGLASLPSVPTPTALPLAKYYPEAEAELMAALGNKRQLPRRVRVEPITDRCHPCFRNPFEGLAAVKERRKLVSTVPLHEGCLLGAYTGELRSGKMDERLVGGDLSGAEGLKAAFTLTLLDDLETRATEQEVWSQAVAPSRDSIVIVGDPSVCPLAEANAPRFWGSCSSQKPGSIGEGDRAACSCRSYKGRVNNAAVIPCVLKIRLSRFKASAEAACGGCVTEDLARGFEVLRTASAAINIAAAAPAGASGTASAGGAAGVAAGALLTAGSSSGRTGGGGGGAAHTSTAAPGTLMASAAGGSSSDDHDKSLFVYGIVTVVVTSNALKEGEEVLLRWDSDDSFFAVADQNLKQYLYIRSLMTERDTAETKVGEHRRQLALLRKAHREAQAAREVAVQRGDEAIQQKEEAERSLEEVIRQRDEAVREWDEALEDVKGQRTAAAAMAAAAGPRVAHLEVQVKQLLAEREALQARLEQLQRQSPVVQNQRYANHLQQDQHGQLQQEGEAMQADRDQRIHEEVHQNDSRRRHHQQEQLQVHSAANALRCSGGGSESTQHVAVNLPGVSELLSEHGSSPKKRQRADRDNDGHNGGLGHEGLQTKHNRQPNDASASAGIGGSEVIENGLNGQSSKGGYAEDGAGLASGAVTPLLLQRYAEAKRQHDARAAELVAALGQREGACWQRAAQLEAQLVDACRLLEAARGRAEEASGRLVEVQRELEASRLRSAQLERQLVINGSSSNGLTNNVNH